MLLCSAVGQARGPAVARAGARTPARRLVAGDPMPTDIRVGVAKGGGNYDVQTIPLETYVARVLGGEALPNSDPAALEALAVAVRTYALANLDKHRADGFDICDETHCQVLRKANPATELAAEATAGQILLRNGAPASIFYHASCGGRTELPSAVWPGAEDPAYLPSAPDDACGGTPAWTAVLALSDLQRSLAAAGYKGTLTDVRVAHRTQSGRVATLALDGLAPSSISGQDLRAVVGRTLGWQHIKSTAFELQHVGAAVRFAGHGSGHGVGMCVIGSVRLAAAGRTAPEILGRYFPGLDVGTTLSRAPDAVLASTGPAPRVPSALGGGASTMATGATASPGAPVTPPALAAALAVVTRPALGASVSLEGLSISIPGGAAADHDRIRELTAKVRDELVRSLGVPAPLQVNVLVHATADDYTQVTGAPWYTSGIALDTTVHLLPLAYLQDRGLLERTLRRALVRLAVDGPLAARPEWVRVGASIYYADSEPQPVAAPVARSGFYRPETPPSCPDDRELRQPASPGELSTAYARARACFARQVASGRSWREVR
jgi:SpoIID/LytB domain protein